MKTMYAGKGRYLLEIDNERYRGSLLVLEKELFHSEVFSGDLVNIIPSRINIVEHYEPDLATERQVFRFYMDEWNLVMADLLYEPVNKAFSVYLMKEYDG